MAKKKGGLSTIGLDEISRPLLASCLLGAISVSVAAYKKKLSRKGLIISDYPDDHYPDLKKELEKPFFIIAGAAQVDPANVCMFNEWITVRVIGCKKSRVKAKIRGDL